MGSNSYWIVEASYYLQEVFDLLLNEVIKNENNINTIK